MKSTPSVQGGTIRDVFCIRPHSHLDELLFSHHVSKFICIKLIKPYFLEMWLFWLPGSLSLALCKASISCFLFCSLVRTDGHDNLAKVDPGHCAPGLSKGTQHICLEPLSPSTGQHLVDTDDVEGLEMYSDVKPFCHSSSPCTCWHKCRWAPGL